MKNFIIILSLIMAQPLMACPVENPSKAKCPKTEITNNSKTWTAEDEQVLKASAKDCPSGVPCLTVFVKYEDGSYQTTCSAK